MEIKVGEIYKNILGLVKVIYVGKIVDRSAEVVLYQRIWQSPKGLIPDDLPACIITSETFKTVFKKWEQV